MIYLRHICAAFALSGLVATASAASCSDAEIAKYHKMERNYEITIRKCQNALNSKSPNVCSVCKAFHSAMWKAEKWRDTHSSCIEKSPANMNRVRENHRLAQSLDESFKALCGY